MTEFTQGIQGVFQKLLTSSSLGLALIYTFGHIIIAMTVVSVMAMDGIIAMPMVMALETMNSGAMALMIYPLPMFQMTRAVGWKLLLVEVIMILIH